MLTYDVQPLIELFSCTVIFEVQKSLSVIDNDILRLIAWTFYQRPLVRSAILSTVY